MLCWRLCVIAASAAASAQDASRPHLLVGFEHEPRTAGRWNFIRWDLVDLAHFKLRLKAEFQGSNRDIYRAEAIIATSAK
jgi:hypothetical protein